MKAEQPSSEYIIDADDFSEDNQGWEFITKIKKAIPNFKITLFTIVGRCSLDFIKEIKEYDWIDMVPHGWMHDNPLECLRWNYKKSYNYLNDIDNFSLTHGFKAPGWQISDGMYKALLKKNYWVADQIYNNERRPKDLRTYLLDTPNKLHFHIQDVCGNGLQESLSQILTLKGNFIFIKDYIKKMYAI